MARQEPDVNLAPDLRDVAWRSVSRPLDFKTGTNYFMGNRVALLPRMQTRTELHLRTPN